MDAEVALGSQKRTTRDDIINNDSLKYGMIVKITTGKFSEFLLKRIVKKNQTCLGFAFESKKVPAWHSWLVGSIRDKILIKHVRLYLLLTYILVQIAAKIYTLTI